MYRSRKNASRQRPFVEDRHPRRKRPISVPKITSNSLVNREHFTLDAEHPDGKPSLEPIMEIVGSVKFAEDPEAALLEHLETTQRQQKQRFAALPEQARFDPWIQIRHQEILHQNQLAHDAALHVLRTLLEPSFAA